jgi:transposase
LAPDFKTIADFRKDDGEAIRLVCREFVMLCSKLNLSTETLVASAAALASASGG